MMSQQLDRILSEAAAKQLSLGQALEWLTDLELESRNSHAFFSSLAEQSHLKRLSELGIASA
jgi:hypothetical protein